MATKTPAAPKKSNKAKAAPAPDAVTLDAVPTDDVAQEATAAAEKAGTGRSRTVNGLTPNEIRVLGLLYKAREPMSRSEMAKELSIKKGWAKLMGTIAKDSEGKGLEGRGLVKALVPAPDQGRAIRYQITAAGRKALEKAEKLAAKA